MGSMLRLSVQSMTQFLRPTNFIPAAYWLAKNLPSVSKRTDVINRKMFISGGLSTIFILIALHLKCHGTPDLSEPHLNRFLRNLFYFLSFCCKGFVYQTSEVGFLNDRFCF